MEATAPRTHLPNQTVRFGLVIGAILIIWLFVPVSPGYVALFAVIGLFMLALKKPVWGIAAFLLSQLSITSFMVNLPIGPSISLRLLLLLLSLLIVWLYLPHKKVTLTARNKAIIIPTIYLTVWSLVANMFNSGLDFTFKDLRNMMVGLLIVILLPAVSKNLKELKILSAVAFVALTASAAIGIMQHFGILGMDRQTIVPGFLDPVSGFGRVPGITESFLNLSYALTVGILTALGIYAARGLKSEYTTILMASMLAMGLALYFTFTRSNYLALVMGFGAMFLFLKTRIKAVVILVLVLSAVSFYEFSGIGENQFLPGRSEESQDESTLSRKVLWQAGMAIATDNPILGIGGDRFKTVSPQYASQVAPELMEQQEEYWSYRDLGKQQPHNDYMFFAISYGVPALIAYMWLLIATIRNFLDSYRLSKSPFIRGISLGLATSTISYSVNAFYHNMMITFPLFWILVGLSVAVANLALQRQVPVIVKPNNGKVRELP